MLNHTRVHENQCLTIVCIYQSAKVDESSKAQTVLVLKQSIEVSLWHSITRVLSVIYGIYKGIVFLLNYKALMYILDRTIRFSKSPAYFKPMYSC